MQKVPALQQPVWEVAALPQFRDRQLDAARPGVPAAFPIPVTGVRAGLRTLLVTRPAGRIGVGAHQRLRERLEHLTQQVRTGLGQLLVQNEGRSILGLAVIVVSPFEDSLVGISENHAVTAPVSGTTPNPITSYTTPVDSTKQSKERSPTRGDSGR